MKIGKRIWVSIAVILSMIAIGYKFHEINKEMSRLNPPDNPDYQEDSLKFNSRIWKKLDREQKHYMVQDLIRNYLKPGMKSTQVQKLLGIPGRVYAGEYIYELGYYRDLDPVYLIIKIDSSGRVVKGYIQEI